VHSCLDRELVEEPAEPTPREPWTFQIGPEVETVEALEIRFDCLLVGL
jgi:hypothetical protein